jgi:hypothetical protein
VSASLQCSRVRLFPLGTRRTLRSEKNIAGQTGLSRFQGLSGHDFTG